MMRFASDKEANEYIKCQVDRPTPGFTTRLGREVLLKGSTVCLEDNRFTNIYDLSFPAGDPEARPELVFFDQLTGIADYIKDNPNLLGAMNGGFFYLADSSSSTPREHSLNFAFANGRVRSLPVVDREALIVETNPYSGERKLSAEYVEALGCVSVNGFDLSWSGSLTDHETDIKIYGNGNSVIEHIQLEDGRRVRLLNKESRFTPPLDPGDGIVDVGFNIREDGVFEGEAVTNRGGMDIFAFNLVARMGEGYSSSDRPLLCVRSIGKHALDGCVQGAVSVGPSIHTSDLSAHPLNNDRSLGSVSPLTDKPLPRALFYETADERQHLTIFDGRPGSDTFTGVTPSEAVDYIVSEYDPESGCLVDGGQTAKLVTPDLSLGNRHYLQFPEQPDGEYVWVPDRGRPVPNMVAIRNH